MFAPADFQGNIGLMFKFSHMHILLAILKVFVYNEE